MIEKGMDQPATSQSAAWRRRLQRLRTNGKHVLLFASGVFVALASFFLYEALTPAPPQLTTNDVTETVAQFLAEATPAPAVSAQIYQAVLPSLVFIETESADADGESGHGVGSGVVISDRGEILTSLHVVADAATIQLTFADGTEAAAQIVAAEPENDIAVLLASQLPEVLVPATLGNPNAMRIGDEAYVIGNPLGLFGSMSSGVISGLKRSFRPSNAGQRLQDLIQFDAAVNPGNSGGPLLNRNGQVVGIVTGLVNPTDQDVFIGIGFAVPINVAGGAAGLPPY